MKKTLLLLIITTFLTISSSENIFRDRIFIDEVQQVSFRFPFSFVMLDQYKPIIAKARFGQNTSMGITITKEGGISLVTEPKLPTIFMNFVEEKDIPDKYKGKDIQTVAKYLSSLNEKNEFKKEIKCETSKYEFYEEKNQKRPHATIKDSPAGITACKSKSKKREIFVLHNSTLQKYYSLSIDKEIDKEIREKIFETIEILQPAKKILPTWRMKKLKKKVIKSDYKITKANKAPNSFKDAYEYETAHYHITSTLHPKKTIAYAKALEIYYKAFLELYKPETTPVYKLELNLFTSQSEMAQIARKINVNIPPTVRGFFSSSHLCIYAYDDGKVNTSKTLIHELSHQFLSATCNGSANVPRWVNEGIAIYFEEGKIKGGKLIAKHKNSRLQWLKKYYGQRKTTFFPLEQYIDNPNAGFGWESYGEVYAMFHLCVFSGKKGKKRFVKFWKELKDGKDGKESFQRIFLNDMIKAQGSRAEALKKWKQVLIKYVMKKM